MPAFVSGSGRDRRHGNKWIETINPRSSSSTTIDRFWKPIVKAIHTEAGKAPDAFLTHYTTLSVDGHPVIKRTVNQSS